MAEIAFVIMQQRGLNVVAVVDEPVEPAAVFMHQPVQPLSVLPRLAFDQVVIASFKDHQKIIQQLRRHGVPSEKIITLSDEEGAAPSDGPVEAALEAPDVIAEVHS